MDMKTIEERAKEAGIVSQYKSDYRYDTRSVESGYIQGATEQKAIDDAEWHKLEYVWVKEAQINHNDVANYKQGYHDAVVKACNIFCHIGCPHETDDYDCLNDKCAAWEKFRKMMEEQI